MNWTTLKKQKVNWRRFIKRLFTVRRDGEDDAEGDVAKGVDKQVDCTSKTRTVIGRFPIARTVSGYENQILIGQIRERNVVSGEERCVTSLKTAAKETTYISARVQIM